MHEASQWSPRRSKYEEMKKRKKLEFVNKFELKSSSEDFLGISHYGFLPENVKRKQSRKRKRKTNLNTEKKRYQVGLKISSAAFHFNCHMRDRAKKSKKENYVVQMKRNKHVIKLS